MKISTEINSTALRFGEEKAVEIRIPLEELRFWDRGEWILDPAYTIYTGFDSRQAMDCARELDLN